MLRKSLFAFALLLAATQLCGAQSNQAQKLEQKPVLLVSDWTFEFTESAIKISGHYFNLTRKPLGGIVGDLRCVNFAGQPVRGTSDEYRIPEGAAKDYAIGFHWETGITFPGEVKECVATLSVKNKGGLVKQGEITLQNNMRAGTQ